MPHPPSWRRLAAPYTKHWLARARLPGRKLFRLATVAASPAVPGFPVQPFRHKSLLVSSPTLCPAGSQEYTPLLTRACQAFAPTCFTMKQPHIWLHSLYGRTARYDIPERSNDAVLLFLRYCDDFILEFLYLPSLLLSAILSSSNSTNRHNVIRARQVPVA